MSRTPVTVRVAETTDVPSLRELWGDILRRGALDEQLADVAGIVATADSREDQCVVVAEVDGEVAGAVYLEATTFTPLNLERAVLAVSPHVFTQFRRKGVGSALMEAACRFAEQHGISHVADGRRRRGARRQPLHGAPVVHPAGDPAGGDDQRRACPAAAVAAGHAGGDQPAADRPGPRGPADPARARPGLSRGPRRCARERVRASVRPAARR